jgi:hypothetical protein
MKTTIVRFRVHAFVALFFAIVVIVAFVTNKYYPVRAIAGEDSVGTWLSGVLLVMAMTLSLVAGKRRGALLWYMAALFFLLCAADEHFMFHEQFKERLIFAFTGAGSGSGLLFELPILAGAAAGIAMTALLWPTIRRNGRVLLAGAAAFGGLSVVIDVLGQGVFIEDCCKLAAELLIVLLLIGETDG